MEMAAQILRERLVQKNWYFKSIRKVLKQKIWFLLPEERVAKTKDSNIRTMGLVSYIFFFSKTHHICLSETNTMSTVFGNAGSESLARRTQITISDPVFQSMKQKFADDFDFSVPGAMKLHNFISKLKKWIRLLENKITGLPKYVNYSKLITNAQSME